MKKKLSYGIIGLGRFGTSLAYELSSMGAEILVLDKDEEKIQSIREITEHSLIVKSLDKKTLLIEMAKAGYKDENNIFLCEILIDGTFIFIKKE